jgi:tRNA(fMet)-specific endonuclease VapC
VYLLDSDTLIYSLKAHPTVMRNLSLHADDPLGVSAITLMELYYGAFKSQQVSAARAGGDSAG